MWGLELAVGRFQVMATLQAARALALGLSEPEAKSWGLNRAIFYAAAKRGFREKALPRRREWSEILQKPVHETREAYFLGDEMAYKAKREGKTYFTIGGEIQTESEFQRQIESRFGKAFAKAWKEALALIKQFPREVLLSQSAFYEEVYKPRRDDLAAKWTEVAKSS